jgi:hypothetical protein
MKCALACDQPCYAWLVGLGAYPINVFLASFDLWADVNGIDEDSEDEDTDSD